MENNKIFNYLNDLNIDFNRIKRMTLKVCDTTIDDIYENNLFFSNLFSINNIENNLIFLKIHYHNCNISPNSFEKINSFKSLKYLFVRNVTFKRNFTIKLKDLIIFNCDYCINIDISENIKFKDLKELNMPYNEIVDVKLNFYNFENLETLNLNHNKISKINFLKNANLKKLIKLDLSNNEIVDINILEEVKFDNLKELYLSNNKISNIDILKNIKFPKLEILHLLSNQIDKDTEKKFSNFNYISFSNCYY